MDGAPPCPICEAAAAFYCSKPPAIYFRCPRCAAIFQHPVPSVEEMAAYAEREYAGGVYAEYVHARDLKYRMFRARVGEILKRTEGKRLIDVGCSCGYLIDVALEHGFDAHGVEFSAAAIAAASEPARGRIMHGDVNRLPSLVHGSYDAVTAFDVIEHTHDPRRFLTDLKTLLPPRGLLAITTPDAGHFLRALMRTAWPMLQPFQHTCLFSRRSLRLALETSGFTNIEIVAARKILTPDYLAGQIRSHNPWLAGSYGAVARILPRALRHMPVSINISEMMAFARRGDDRE